MRDFRTMTPSSRRSTAMSRCSHSILRKAGFSSTAATFPFILRLPKYRPVLGLLSLFDIDRLSLFEKGPRVQRLGHEVSYSSSFRPSQRVARMRAMTGSARAGTHNHKRLLLRTMSTILADRNIPQYGSPLPRGRRQSVVTAAECVVTAAPCGWRRRGG